MVSDNTNENEKFIERLVAPIRNDLLSGAAEIALQAIVVFKTVLSFNQNTEVKELRENLKLTGLKLIEAQPAMASLVNLANVVLAAANKANSADQIKQDCLTALNLFEKVLCDSVAKIAETALSLLPPGEMVFAYSFSSTVVSCLLNARSKVGISEWLVLNLVLAWRDTN